MKKVVRFLFVQTVFSLFTFTGFAQEIRIDTDRPDQGDGVATVPKGWFQVEEGATIADNTFINNLMFRVGVGQATEVRLLIDAGREDGVGGLKPVTISLKQRLTKQHGVLPAVSFVGYLSYERLATKNFSGNKVPYELKLAFENELSEKLTLGYNAGASDDFNHLNLTTGFSYTISERVSVLAEYFSTITHGADLHNIDAAILYLVTPRLQLDLDVGRGIFSSDSRYFSTFGISYLFR